MWSNGPGTEDGQVGSGRIKVNNKHFSHTQYFIRHMTTRATGPPEHHLMIDVC